MHFHLFRCAVEAVDFSGSHHKIRLNHQSFRSGSLQVW